MSHGNESPGKSKGLFHFKPITELTSSQQRPAPAGNPDHKIEVRSQQVLVMVTLAHQALSEITKPRPQKDPFGRTHSQTCSAIR